MPSSLRWGYAFRAVLRATIRVGALALGIAYATGAAAAPQPPAAPPLDNPFGASTTEAPPPTSAPPANATDDEPMSRLEQPAAEATPAGDDAESRDQSADDSDEDAAATPRPSSLHGLACLEGDTSGGGRRKGVQRRDFLKRHRFELSGLGGYYASDTLSSTYSYGGALAFYPSEDFGLEALVTRSPVRFRLEEPFSGFDREHHFQPGTAWQAILSLLWSPIHAKLKFTEESILHGDLFVVAGAGRTFHESVLGLTWEAGAGMKIYLARYVAFRLDVRDFLLPQEVLGRGRNTNNVTVLGGISAWLL